MRRSYFEILVSAGVLSLAGASFLACNDADTSGGTGGSTGGGGSSGGSGGGAQCGPGAELCGDACTVTAIDPDNCGACGKACGAEEACQAGACVFECNGGASKCGASCVDTQADPKNCGGCGTACDAAQEVCSAGHCVATCGTGGLLRCDELCVDTQKDTLHCGDCATACNAGEACVSGHCTVEVPPKGVYTMTNDPSGNKILAFARAADGTLSESGSFVATGGRGTGSGLGNQHGLVFDGAQNRFFVVNAGDHSISMLSLHLDGSLELLSNVPSGGERPISVTASGDVVYVLNAGVAADNAAGNVSGFKIVGETLVPIQGSTMPLSAANPNPAQIQFSPDGKTLVVTEKGTNMVVTYTVSGGIATGPITKVAAGQTPFGFDFSAGQQVIVSEAWGGAANASTASSYAIGANGFLTTVTAAIPTTRTAACWLVVAGAYAYMANAQTNDITGFQIAADGALTLLDASGVTGTAGKGATDEDVTDDGDLLYVVNNGDHSLSIFGINANGSLTKKPDFLGLPSTASGLVAR